jgi:hypothetical protein
VRSLALLLLALAGCARVGTAERAPVDVLAWFEKGPPEFGCWVERALGYRDPRWNCDLTGWSPSGDPCDDTAPYYEGPELPEADAKRLDHRLRTIGLDWEHGRLREVVFYFEGPVTESLARGAFGLPAEGAPAGFLDVGMQLCSKSGTCLHIEKFEHQGAGDVDCDAVRAARSR